MERTHGQLGTRLTNGLCSHDANGLADINELAGSHGLAVALSTNAGRGLAGQHGANLDLGDLSVKQLLGELLGEVGAGLGHNLAVFALDIRRKNAAGCRGLPQLGENNLVTGNLADWDAHALAGATVLFADDDVLGHVHQTTGEVAGVSGTQCGIGQALTGTVGVVEVLQHGQTFAEGGLNRTGDVITVRVHNHALHTGQRPDLTHVTGSTRLHNHRNRVVVRVHVLDGLTDGVGSVLPQLYQAVVALALGQGALLPVLALDALCFLLIRLEDLGLIRQNQNVRHGDGHAGTGCPVEASILHVVQHLSNGDHRVLIGQVIDHVTDENLVAGAAALTDHDALEVRVVPWQQLVEHHAADGGVAHPCLALGPAIRELLFLDLLRRAKVIDADLDRGLQTNGAAVIGHEGLSVGGEDAGSRLVLFCLAEAAVATDLILGLVHGQVVQAGNHVQTRHGQRFTGCWGQNVIGRQHQDAGLCLRLSGQRQVDCHLVTVEVGVERLTSQRVQLNSLTLNQLRLEGLDTQAVQRRCTVEHHWVLRNGLLQNVPHLRALALNHALGGLDVLGVVIFYQALHNERLE